MINRKRIWKDIFGQRTEYLTKAHPAAEMFQVVGSPLSSSVLGWEDQLVASIAPAHIEVASVINLHLHAQCTNTYVLGVKSMLRQKVSGNQIRWHRNPRFWVTRGISPMQCNNHSVGMQMTIMLRTGYVWAGSTLGSSWGLQSPCRRRVFPCWRITDDRDVF